MLTGGHKSLLVALAVLAFTDANAVEPGFAALVALIMHFVQAAFATVVSKLWKLYARLERADVKDAVAVAVATGMASPSTFGAKADMSVKPMSPTSDSQVRYGGWCGVRASIVCYRCVGCDTERLSLFFYLPR